MKTFREKLVRVFTVIQIAGSIAGFGFNAMNGIEIVRAKVTVESFAWLIKAPIPPAR